MILNKISGISNLQFIGYLCCANGMIKHCESPRISSRLIQVRIYFWRTYAKGRGDIIRGAETAIRGVLQFAKFTGKQLKPQTCNVNKKETLKHAFSCEFCKILNTFYRTPSDDPFWRSSLLRQMKEILIELMHRLYYFIIQSIDWYYNGLDESIFLFLVLFSRENCIWSLFLFITAWFSLGTSGETTSWITLVCSLVCWD